MTNQAYTLRILCPYIYIYIHILYFYTYTYILIALRFTTHHEQICTIMYKWIQNYSEISRLSFGYKEKATTTI